MVPEDDKIRLLHMIEAARDAVAFVEGKSREEFETERATNQAVVRAVTVLGEAASQVSPPTRAEFSDLPWGEMVGMRNRPVHAYHDINLAIVWRTVSEDLPPLIDCLSQIVDELSHQED